MSLSSPHFTFTIPSVHDDTLLSCRLYLPRKHFVSGEGQAPKAAIVAHPYAPLGGCYDDPVVNSVGVLLSRAGYVVGTFNFRGASGSAGHTSWSAKPELGDYVSFYGFMIHYLNGLMSEDYRQFSEVAKQQPSSEPSATEWDRTFGSSVVQPRLILAGYSYGCMIASHLPSIDRVVKLFKGAARGSAESEIQLRASHLSSQTMKDLKLKQELNHGPASLRIPKYHIGSRKSSSPVLVGGFESEATEQRIDQESRRSLDARKSLDRVRVKIHARPHRHPDTSVGIVGAVQAGLDCSMISPQICYLLISPVLSPVATFATFFSSLSFKEREFEKYTSQQDGGHQITRCPSLAVYGSKDFFTSAKKLRKWAHGLSQTPGSIFQYREVDGAGHFWRETSTLEQMKNHVGEWENSL